MTITGYPCITVTIGFVLCVSCEQLAGNRAIPYRGFQSVAKTVNVVAISVGKKGRCLHFKCFKEKITNMVRTVLQ